MDESTTAKNRGTLEPAKWVDRYGDYLYRYAMSRLRDGEAAEEVVQQTFLAGLRHARQFSGKGAEHGWLLGILKRKIVDFIRQRNRAGSLMDDQGEDLLDSFFDPKGSWKRELRSTLTRPLDSLERDEFWKVLRACLDALPTRQADIFVLREMDDRGTEEICKDLGITASNLWVLLHRARLRLSTCMQSRWRHEES